MATGGRESNRIFVDTTDPNSGEHTDVESLEPSDVLRSVVGNTGADLSAPHVGELEKVHATNVASSTQRWNAFEPEALGREN